MRAALVVSERRACRVLAQPRSTQRHPARVATDEPALIARIIALARRFGRSGYRRITALRRAEGWRVNPKRVERLWRQEGLRVPRKAPRRRRLWATDGSCTRRRAERPNHVWSDAFVHERTEENSMRDPLAEPQPEADPDHSGLLPAEPAASVGQRTTLRLAGAVPPEVWNRLGTRILPKLRSSDDLNVKNDFSVSVDAA